jgi:alkylation response protein AidB-like acyl-CoA dehydrogenase
MDLTLELEGEQRELVLRARHLARDKFAPRASANDLSGCFPHENFRDIFEAGFNAPALAEEDGGLGLGPYRGDVLCLWMITKEFAKVDLALARCWEGHTNSLVLLDGMATEEQRDRWFPRIVDDGQIWVAWSGEPQARGPSQTTGFGTSVAKVDGGYLVNGCKVFATSAGGARWAILLVSTAGPGGARHGTGPIESQLLLACDLTDSSLEIDTSWWDPIGMRSTASHLVRFHDAFIPEANLIGYPGQYLKDNWQTCFIPHYAASFLGAAEGAYDFALEYVSCQGKSSDPYIQHHIAQASINVECGHLWLQHVARLWEAKRFEEAQIAGSRARHAIEHLADDTVRHCIRACGARSLNRPSPLERIYRDLSFYVRHDNDDQILATIGKSLLGEHHDPSFYKP